MPASKRRRKQRRQGLTDRRRAAQRVVDETLGHKPPEPTWKAMMRAVRASGLTWRQIVWQAVRIKFTRKRKEK